MPVIVKCRLGMPCSPHTLAPVTCGLDLLSSCARCSPTRTCYGGLQDTSSHLSLQPLSCKDRCVLQSTHTGLVKCQLDMPGRPSLVSSHANVVAYIFVVARSPLNLPVNVACVSGMLFPISSSPALSKLCSLSMYPEWSPTCSLHCPSIGIPGFSWCVYC